ncbi:ABC transporter ATP-binding protein [Pararhodobacter sp. CCB-MM2]|uniref:ABC transporter ATP-binding protein n=1 Tax=Pararhodobacter sp. CCB-MM2 TaxID=1786003 RepID=UPI00082C5B35|nr:ABC transporter ATP-binding protein [Pararhodobacter sp. CCB-MM2]
MTLELNDFSIVRGRQTVISRCAVSLPSNGLIAVVGPNGAGKSTLLMALAGLLRHTGKRTLDGAPIAQGIVGFLPQTFAVRSALSVEDCVLLGRREELGLRVRPVLREAAHSALAQLGLATLAERRMDSLSGGQQQLVLIAQRLMRSPRLMILDEPTSALDLYHQLEVLTQLRALSTNMLTIAALHDLTLASRFADALLLVRGGTLVAGRAQDVLCAKHLREAWHIEPEFLTDRAGMQVVVPHRLPAGPTAQFDVPTARY